jgi:hypothetical protein
MFNDLVVPKLEDCKQIIFDLHSEIGHFGEGRTFAEINKCYCLHMHNLRPLMARKFI